MYPSIAVSLALISQVDDGDSVISPPVKLPPHVSPTEHDREHLVARIPGLKKSVWSKVYPSPVLEYGIYVKGDGTVISFKVQSGSCSIIIG